MFKSIRLSGLSYVGIVLFGRLPWALCLVHFAGLLFGAGNLYLQRLIFLVSAFRPANYKRRFLLKCDMTRFKTWVLSARRGRLYDAGNGLLADTGHEARWFQDGVFTVIGGCVKDIVISEGAEEYSIVCIVVRELIVVSAMISRQEPGHGNITPIGGKYHGRARSSTDVRL
jgi:hypothetical protein